MIIVLLFISFLVFFIIKPKKFSKYNCKIVLPITIIKNGKILYENLYTIKKDKDWLINTLQKKEIYNIKNIKEATILSNGILDIKSNSIITEKKIDNHLI
ncbi:DUF421 domain-containing protein [Clostridium sp. D2Q-14]|uniref:YetF domain-containing protein n=1 Tax=Anaeromonas gelatinilytica TaxID=2683194 RepID=UPI00193B2DF1|nr:YetF domain-containing protein [Anaeromonas gelatinilytica]MBS4534302.1 DUF421 domain-containing protein [Anaeromonas gelatinilytica]